MRQRAVFFPQVTRRMMKQPARLKNLGFENLQLIMIHFMRLFRPWIPLNVIRVLCFVGFCCAMTENLQAQAWTNKTLSASQRASLLLAQMTFNEKAAMVYGVAGPTGSNYVGNIANNTRLGIPWLFLKDGPAGLRLSETTTTPFPAPIDIAASWDVALARQYGS